MASNLDAVEYNYRVDLEEMEHIYPATDVQYLVLNDMNNNNYANNYINFSNVSLVGQNTEKYLDFSQGYLQIPFTYTATLSATAIAGGAAATAINAYFGQRGNADAAVANVYTAGAITDMPENAFAVGVKPFHHLIDSASIRINGIPINRNSSHLNFYINEQLKKMDRSEQLIMGDILNYALDNAESLLTTSADSQVNEFNNNTVPATGLAQGGQPSQYANAGHVERCTRLNQDLSLSNLKAGGVNSANLSNYQASCFLGAQNVAAGNKYSQISWTVNAMIPLSKISDWFAKMPSINSTSGFELRLQTNIGSPANNSWSYSWTVDATNAIATNAQFTQSDTRVTSKVVSASQAFGRTCPFIISPPCQNGGSGTGFAYAVSGYTAGSANSSYTVTCKVTSQIGYNIPSGGSPQFPCRLHIPMVTYHPDYAQTIIKQPAFKMLYRDYFVDTITSVQQGSNVSRLYNVQLSRPRTMYIVPFLSASNLGSAVKSAQVVPYQSLTSSAPTTCSPCKLRNFQLMCGGSPMFITPLQFGHEFYNNSALQLLAKSVANGNSYKSQFISGLVSRRMFDLAYGVYAFNVEKVPSVEQDNQQKSFQVTFTVETNAVNYAYDFLLIMDYECEMYLDRQTGTIDKPSQ